MVLFRKPVVVFTLISAQSIFAWRSQLYPETWSPPGVTTSFYTEKMIQDFSYAGYHRGEEPVPDVKTGIIDVTKPPYNADKTGTNDATSAIQNAITQASSSGGGVVYLPAGIYKVNPGSNSSALRISSDNVVLRGDGIGKTFILNTSYQMRGKSVINISPSGGASWTSPPSTHTKITSDLMGPALTIPVENPGIFNVDDWVLIRSDITSSWIAEHQEQTEWGGSTFSGFIYYRKIINVNTGSKTVTIDAPTRYAMKTRDNARIHLSPVMLQETGIEDLSIGNVQHPGTTGWGEEDYSSTGNASYDCHNSWLISLSRVCNSWVRRVASYQPSGNSTTAHLLSNGLQIAYSRGVTVDSCHFQRGQYGGGGGNGYMYRIQANECLISNSKATFCRHGFVLSHMYSCGNVFLKCYDKDNGKQTGATGSGSTSGKGSDHHMHFSASNLFDGCTSDNSNFQAAYRPYGSVPKHNLTAAHSVYWNTCGLGTGVTSYVIYTQQARYGYVIGTWGTRTDVRTTPVNAESEVKTNPVDHVEGKGEGETLEPKSLYEDQLSKRLAATHISERNTIKGLVFRAGNAGNKFTAYTLSGKKISGIEDAKDRNIIGKLKSSGYRGVFIIKNSGSGFFEGKAIVE